MKWLAVVLALMLAPSVARSEESSRAAVRAAAPASACRPLAYRAYLACLAAETRMLAAGVNVDGTSCTTAMESVKRDCARDPGGRAADPQRATAVITIRFAAADATTRSAAEVTGGR